MTNEARTALVERLDAILSRPDIHPETLMVMVSLKTLRDVRAALDASPPSLPTAREVLEERANFVARRIVGSTSGEHTRKAIVESLLAFPGVPPLIQILAPPNSEAALSSPEPPSPPPALDDPTAESVLKDVEELMDLAIDASDMRNTLLDYVQNMRSLLAEWNPR